jgi:hypothetical protein
MADRLAVPTEIRRDGFARELEDDERKIHRDLAAAHDARRALATPAQLLRP